MESLENPQTRSLRVMRFSFEANEALQAELTLQLNEKQRRITALRFYASKQLVIPMNDYYRREGDLQKIGRRFRNFHEPIQVRPAIASRQIDELTTRFRLLPTNQTAFDVMTSFDPVVDPNYPYNRPEPIPNKVEKQPETGHYLFVDVAADALLGVGQRKMAERTFSTRAATGRFWLRTEALRTVKDINYTIPSPAEELPDDEDKDVA